MADVNQLKYKIDFIKSVKPIYYPNQADYVDSWMEYFELTIKANIEGLELLGHLQQKIAECAKETKIRPTEMFANRSVPSQENLIYLSTHWDTLSNDVIKIITDFRNVCFGMEFDYLMKAMAKKYEISGTHYISLRLSARSLLNEIRITIDKIKIVLKKFNSSKYKHAIDTIERQKTAFETKMGKHDLFYKVVNDDIESELNEVIRPDIESAAKEKTDFADVTKRIKTLKNELNAALKSISGSLPIFKETTTFITSKHISIDKLKEQYKYLMATALHICADSERSEEVIKLIGSIFDVADAVANLLDPHKDLAEIKQVSVTFQSKKYKIPSSKVLAELETKRKSIEPQLLSAYEAISELAYGTTLRTFIVCLKNLNHEMYPVKNRLILVGKLDELYHMHEEFIEIRDRIHSEFMIMNLKKEFRNVQEFVNEVKLESADASFIRISDVIDSLVNGPVRRNFISLINLLSSLTMPMEDTIKARDKFWDTIVLAFNLKLNRAHRKSSIASSFEKPQFTRRPSTVSVFQKEIKNPEDLELAIDKKLSIIDKNRPAHAYLTSLKTFFNRNNDLLKRYSSCSSIFDEDYMGTINPFKMKSLNQEYPAAATGDDINLKRYRLVNHLHNGLETIRQLCISKEHSEILNLINSISEDVQPNIDKETINAQNNIEKEINANRNEFYKLLDKLELNTLVRNYKVIHDQIESFNRQRSVGRTEFLKALTDVKPIINIVVTKLASLFDALNEALIFFNNSIDKIGKTAIGIIKVKLIHYLPPTHSILKTITRPSTSSSFLSTASTLHTTASTFQSIGTTLQSPASADETMSIKSIPMSVKSVQFIEPKYSRRASDFD